MAREYQADDLEDNLDLESIASSSAAADLSDDLVGSLSEEEVNFASHEPSEPEQVAKAKGGKRKLEEEAGGGGPKGKKKKVDKAASASAVKEDEAAAAAAVKDDNSASNPAPSAKKAKAKKQKKKKQQSSGERALLGLDEDEEEEQEQEVFGAAPPDVLALRINEKGRRALPGLTELERHDLRITEDFLVDTSSFLSPRHDLGDFIRLALPSLLPLLSKPPSRVASPRVLVLSGAALRVADLCRQVKVFETEKQKVGKLFARHFKLEEHREWVGKTRICIAVGTPGRLARLVEDDSLKISHLSHLILDASYIDSKKRTLLDLPDCKEDLWLKLLGKKEILKKLREGRMKIVVY